MTLFCLTNDFDDEFRPCTRNAQHYANCGGYEVRYNSTRRRYESTARDCRGCVPRGASIGLLCWTCWERVQSAFTEWTPLLARAMWQNDRLVQRDNAGIRSSADGHVNLPGTLLALNEINSYLESFYKAKSDTQLWVSTFDGAIDALRFARAVPTAVRTHAIEEKTSKLRRTRCPKCTQLSFTRIPPTIAAGPIKVECQTPECGYVIKEGRLDTWGDESIDVIADIEDPGARQVKTRHDVHGWDAEPYEPARAEHEHLDKLSTQVARDLRNTAREMGVARAGSMTKPELITAIRAAEELAVSA